RGPGRGQGDQGDRQGDSDQAGQAPGDGGDDAEQRHLVPVEDPRGEQQIGQEEGGDPRPGVVAGAQSPGDEHEGDQDAGDGELAAQPGPGGRGRRLRQAEQGEGGGQQPAGQGGGGA